MVDDEFHTRTVEFAFHRKRLTFDLARTVFASAGIDPGSTFLLRFMQDVPPPAGRRVLDIGCGVGTLGIVLAALDDERHVTLADRDALALRYTGHNLELNGIGPERATVVGSLGADDVDDAAPFDVVVCNVPGKAGPPVIDHLVRRSVERGRKGTVIGMVVVNPLAPALDARFDADDVDVICRRENKTHTVLIATVATDADPAPGSAPSAASVSGFDAGVYDREVATFSASRLEWRATTVFGIGEFDTLAHPTRLLRGALHGMRSAPSTVIAPGQGHRAVVAALAGYPPVRLVDRDLLALRASARALQANNVALPQLEHTVDLEPGRYDDTPVVCLHAEDKVHGPWFVAQVKACLERQAEVGNGKGDRHLVLSGRAGLLGRLEADVLARRKRGHIAYKKSQRGARVLRYTY